MSDEDKSKEITDAQNEEVKEPEQSPGTKSTEKTLTQTEVNKILADERRKHDAQFKALKGEFDTFRGEIEAKEKAANDAAAEQVEALRKDLPESIIELLDELSPLKQLEWLTNPKNAITKKQIPELPNPAEGHGKQRKQINVV
jgi:hypothetical protein